MSGTAAASRKSSLGAISSISELRRILIHATTLLTLTAGTDLLFIGAPGEPA
jgi:hypothetical protein